MKRPFLMPVICFISGVLSSDMTVQSPGTAVFICLVILLVSVIVISIAGFYDKRSFYASICVFFFLLGVFRHTTVCYRPSGGIDKIIAEGGRVVLSGSVCDCPVSTVSRGSCGVSFSLRADRVFFKNKTFDIRAKVLVRLALDRQKPEIGDELLVTGNITGPSPAGNPFGFDQRRYFAFRGLDAVVYSRGPGACIKTGRRKGTGMDILRSLYGIRRKAREILERYLSGTTLSIVEPVLLGIRGRMRRGQKELFTRTGVMHVLAISGLHTGIVGFTVFGLFQALGARKEIACLFSIICMLSFCLFSGARPSSLRAVIMCSLVLLAKISGKKPDIMNSLYLSAFIISFLDPRQLFHPGFILSYAAVLSIIHVVPLTDRFLNVPDMAYREPKTVFFRRMIMRSVSVSFSIWVGTSVLTAHYFGIITFLPVLSNLVAIPLLSVFIISGGCVILCGAFDISGQVAGGIALFLDRIVGVFTGSLSLISKIPFSFLNVPSPDRSRILIFYLFFTGIIFFYKGKKRASHTVLFLLMFTANFFVWNEACIGRDRCLKVTFFDVGKADAAFLEFSNGSCMLIDSGSRGEYGGIRAGKDVIAPYLLQKGKRYIDAVLLSHVHEDHVGGMKYLGENFNIGTLITAAGVLPGKNRTGISRSVMKILKKNGVNHMEVGSGDVISGFPGVKMFVLNPPVDKLTGDPNEDSVVIKLMTLDGKSMLFCGDAGCTAIREMLSFGDLLRSDIIKFPHHGKIHGDTVAIKEFMKRIKGAVAIISNNHEDGVKAEKWLKKRGIRTFLTAKTGAVIVKESGTRFLITRFKNSGKEEIINTF